MLPGHFGQQGKKELPTAQEHNEASQEEEKEEKAPVPDTLDAYSKSTQGCHLLVPSSSRTILSPCAP